MKNLVLIRSLSMVLMNCGAVSRTTFGTTEKKLIQTVSVEQGCPKENIKITDNVKTFDNKWERIGNSLREIPFKQLLNLNWNNENRKHIRK